MDGTLSRDSGLARSPRFIPAALNNRACMIFLPLRRDTTVSAGSCTENYCMTFSDAAQNDIW